MVNRKKLMGKIAFRFSLLPLFMAALILLPAGTLDYWQLYLYCGVLFLPMFFVLQYFWRRNPEFLERRMKSKENIGTQRKLIGASIPLFVIGFILCGLDQRFGWSRVPVSIVLAADIVVFAAYALIFLVFRANSYASRVVEVSTEQKVISTGPYAIVRHPMYVGVLLLYLATPVALASYWALIPFVLFIGILIARIRSEERELSEKLPGYSEYCARVKYRLLPYLW